MPSSAVPLLEGASASIGASAVAGGAGSAAIERDDAAGRSEEEATASAVADASARHTGASPCCDAEKQTSVTAAAEVAADPTSAAVVKHIHRECSVPIRPRIEKGWISDVADPVGSPEAFHG